MSEPTPSPPQNSAAHGMAAGTAGTTRSRTEFSLVRVLVAAVIVAAIGGLAWYGYDHWAHATPELAPARGRVFYNGKPLPDGLVTTRPTAGKNLMGAMADIDENGEFELTTNGEPGAYVGRHKVMVTLTKGGFPPQPLLPGEYATAGSTPLEMQVASDSEQNVFKFHLTGEELPDLDLEPKPMPSMPYYGAEPAGDQPEEPPGEARQSGPDQ